VAKVLLLLRRHKLQAPAGRASKGMGSTKRVTQTDQNRARIEDPSTTAIVIHIHTMKRIAITNDAIPSAHCLGRAEVSCVPRAIPDRFISAVIPIQNILTTIRTAASKIRIVFVATPTIANRRLSPGRFAAPQPRASPRPPRSMPRINPRRKSVGMVPNGVTRPVASTIPAATTNIAAIAPKTSEPVPSPDAPGDSRIVPPGGTVELEFAKPIILKLNARKTPPDGSS